MKRVRGLRICTIGAVCSSCVLGCENTPGWHNKFGATCKEYEDQHCKDGSFLDGHAWTGGEQFNMPEKNCCACFATNIPPCSDTINWKNQYGADCEEYALLRCKGGGFLDGEEWSAGREFGSPELHCCACGKVHRPLENVVERHDEDEDYGYAYEMDSLALAQQRSSCIDSSGWRNKYGATCAKYVHDLLCKDGRVVEGQAWASGAEYNFPERNCCACGKGTRTPPPHPHPPPPSPPPCDAVRARKDLRQINPPTWCVALSFDRAACERSFVSWDLPNGRLVSLCYYDDGECQHNELHSCLSPPSPPPPPARRICRDTPTWKNPYGLDCLGYVREGHCFKGGIVPGHSWAMGEQFGWPELHCCACGKIEH